MTNPLDGLPLPVQFACFPEHWQGALLSITDVLGGMTRDEMEEAHRLIDHVARTESLAPKTAALLRSLVGLAVWVEVTIDEERINAARQMWATENEENDS